MKSTKISRRQALKRAGVMTGAALAAAKHSSSKAAEPAGKSNSTFVYCLNTATIRGQKVGIVKEVEITAQAGYQAIEPWIESIEDYSKKGGSLKDLKQRIADQGLTVESAIGFSQWIVDDDEKRAKGLERAKFEMDLVAQIGGKRIAAPPAGATDVPGMDLLKAAERYRALLDAGTQIGIIPQLELWGFSKNFYRLGQCACSAIESGHSDACILIDVFHLYKGGSDIRGLKLLSGNSIHVLHMNDYPSEPAADKINDSFRTYPGDGIAPIKDILQMLKSAGGQKILSLELFNRKYWAEDAAQVAKTGLAKMKEIVAAVS